MGLSICSGAGDSKVILCMLPATNDMATHESLTIARELDPEQRRTVGVITKIDVHSDGLRRKLEPVGDDIKLELGFVAVGACIIACTC